MIIDAHIHLWNRLHGDDLGIDRKALSWGKAEQQGEVFYAASPAFEDSLSTYERAIAHMDWLGIDRAVVLQEFMDGKQDDYLVEVRKLHPTRFSCMALLDKHYFNDPLGCFRKAIDQGGLQGFLVRTPGAPVGKVGVPALLTFWEACAERGLPIMLKNGLPSDIKEIVKAAPELKIVWSHFAGHSGPPEQYRERLEMTATNPNVTIDMGGLTFRHRYPFSKCKEALHEAVQLVGADKIAWGSDYPRPGLVADASYKQQLEFITVECDFLTDAQREQLLSGTALRVYQWDA